MIIPLEIISRIDAHTLATEDQAPRPYLGASEVGEKCLRRLFYKFRWCGQEKLDGRMLRLFKRGDREEAVFDELLIAAGFAVEVPFPEGPGVVLTPEQEEHNKKFKFKDCEGHFAGTCDGVALPPDEDFYVLLEKKSVKKDGPSGMIQLKRQGLKEWNPKYWSQMQTYEGELGLEWGLFCAVCKDDDDLYFEYVQFDRIYFETCLSKAEAVVNATTPPERISNDPKTFSCRYCNFNALCHENQPLPDSQKHCRNCAYSSPAAEGKWECQKGHAFGTLCPNYSPVTGGPAANSAAA